MADKKKSEQKTGEAEALKNNEILEEDEDEIIELVDEEGNEIKFKLLDVTEYKQEKYVLLLAAEPNDEIAEDEVVIFRLNEREQNLEPVEDDKLLDEVFEAYQREIEEEDDDDIN